MAREDPSLRIHQNEHDQTVLAGMGELHLEVILKRIRKEYKIDADLGPLMVAYKEAPVNPARCQIDFERRIAGDFHKVTLDISVKPSEPVTQKPKWKLSKNSLEQLRLVIFL